jgi:hypothetical protein
MQCVVVRHFDNQKKIISSTYRKNLWDSYHGLHSVKFYEAIDMKQHIRPKNIIHIIICTGTRKIIVRIIITLNTDENTLIFRDLLAETSCMHVYFLNFMRCGYLDSAYNINNISSHILFSELFSEILFSHILLLRFLI